MTIIKVENEYYVKFILLLIRAGTKLLRRIVKNGLQKRNVDLHEFLNAERESICKSRQLTKLQRDILYPLSPNVADIEEWDITLLSFIAVEFLHNDLSPIEKQSVIKIREMRNKYQAHTCNAAIDNKTYTLIWTELTLVITTVTYSWSEEEKAEYTTLITNTAVVDFDMAVQELKQLDRSNTYFTSIQRSLEDLQRSHEMLISQNANFNAGLLTVTKELADLKTKIECKGRSTKTVNTIFGKVNVSADEDHIVNAAEEILLNATKICSVETIKSGLKRLVDTFLDDIFNTGVILESVNKGSVILRLICPSVDSMIDLIEYFNSDLIAKRLSDISEALSIEVCEKVNINASINMASLEDAMEKLRLLSTAEEDSDQHATKKRICRDKVFNDPIHGQISFHQLCVKIIDTPQFQRLRFIRQLEACYLVFPGASHNRFEHSLGVCFLAGELLRAIKERQPEANIDDKDILCVEIAALCHDLGQGPFSHVFEEQFLPSVDPENEWRHEHASVKMFEYILESNNCRIRRYFEKLMPDFEDRDITFIKELIGVPANLDSKVWPYAGRQKDKSFLYEVVANKTSGVDVDKWDYLARDSQMLGMKSNFDHNRCIYSARILISNGRKQICYRDKTAQDLYDMFYTRMTLHRRAYQHKTKNIIGIMICDALIAANDELVFTGENGVELRMSETINDMVAYTKLTDDIFQTIVRSSDIRLKRSRDILNSVLNRDLYYCVSQTQIKGGSLEKLAFKENLFNKIHQKQEDVVEMAENFAVIDVVNLDYGMKNKDPVQNVRFYSKRNVNAAVEIDKSQVSFVLPDTFAEQYVRVYCKVTDSYLIDVIEESFAEWCVENSHPLSQGSSLRRNSLK